MISDPATRSSPRFELANFPLDSAIFDHNQRIVVADSDLGEFDNEAPQPPSTPAETSS